MNVTYMAQIRKMQQMRQNSCITLGTGQKFP